MGQKRGTVDGTSAPWQGAVAGRVGLSQKGVVRCEVLQSAVIGSPDAMR